MNMNGRVLSLIKDCPPFLGGGHLEHLESVLLHIEDLLLSRHPSLGNDAVWGTGCGQASDFHFQ